MDSGLSFETRTRPEFYLKSVRSEYHVGRPRRPLIRVSDIDFDLSLPVLYLAVFTDDFTVSQNLRSRL